MIADCSLADRIGAKARARNSGPRKFVSTFARISSSVWVRMPGLGVRQIPALLISTVTSGAASTAAWMEAGSVTSRVSGTMRSSSQVARVAGGGIDLAAPRARASWTKWVPMPPLAPVTRTTASVQ